MHEGEWGSRKRLRVGPLLLLGPLLAIVVTLGAWIQSLRQQVASLEQRVALLEMLPSLTTMNVPVSRVGVPVDVDRAMQMQDLSIRR